MTKQNEHDDGAIADEAIEKQNKPFSELTFDEAIERLSQLPRGEYEQQRKEKAKELEIRVTALDKFVNGDTGGSDSIADELVQVVNEKVTLFHDPDRKAYASFEHDGHIETWQINSTGFREYASHLFYDHSGKAPSEASISAAFQTLSGIAKYEGSEWTVYLRCATYKDGYVVDLCNESWSVIQVTPRGWQELTESPVKFYRTDNMRPLPVPAETGDISKLWRYVNVLKADRGFIIAWVLECYREDTHFTIVEFMSSQGGAKSFSQNCLRNLIDPNAVNLRVSPKATTDVYVGANNNWLASWNNVSRLSSGQQDAMCSLATGGGFAARTLYTNTEETVVDVKRPVIMNGISTLATAQDLVDRILHFDLPPIKSYIAESVLVEQFNNDAPEIFTGILDLFAKTLSHSGSREIKNLPRMGDFAKLGEAMYSALDYQVSFTDEYTLRRQQASVLALESSPVAQAVMTYMDNHVAGYPNGRIGALFEKLEQYHTPGEAWVKSPRGLGDALRRHMTGLKTAGISVQFDQTRHKDGLYVSLQKIHTSEKDKTIEKQHTQRTPHTPDALKTPEPEPDGVHGVCRAHAISDKNISTDMGNSEKEVHAQNWRDRINNGDKDADIPW